MPLYDYKCTGDCGRTIELAVAYAYRDAPFACPTCGGEMERQMPAPMGRVAGRVVDGGGPDRFTADVMGIPLKDLPAGLRTKPSGRGS